MVIQFELCPGIPVDRRSRLNGTGADTQGVVGSGKQGVQLSQKQEAEVCIGITKSNPLGVVENICLPKDLCRRHSFCTLKHRDTSPWR